MRDSPKHWYGLVYHAPPDHLDDLGGEMGVNRVLWVWMPSHNSNLSLLAQSH